MKSRREFLKNAVVGTAGVAASWNASSYARIVGANDRVAFAIAGLHGRGIAHLECLRGVPNCDLAYICDVDSREFPKFGASATKAFGKAPKQEKDIRKVLESKDVDAIHDRHTRALAHADGVDGAGGGQTRLPRETVESQSSRRRASHPGAEEVREARAVGRPAALLDAHHRGHGQDQGGADRTAVLRQGLVQQQPQGHRRRQNRRQSRPNSTGICGRVRPPAGRTRTTSIRTTGTGSGTGAPAKR